MTPLAALRRDQKAWGRTASSSQGVLIFYTGSGYVVRLWKDQWERDRSLLRRASMSVSVRDGLIGGGATERRGRQWHRSGRPTNTRIRGFT
jgi:hypothetical protein